MTEIAKLIERLENAEAGSRELDAYLFAYANGGRIHWIDASSGELVWEKPIDGMWIRRPALLRKMPRYSASLDAAVAVVERLLPGFCIELFVGTGGTARVFNPASHGNGFRSGIRATPALALCLATLKSLDARDKPTI